MIKFSLLRIGLLCIPGCVVATDVLTVEEPVPNGFIVTFVDGYLNKAGELGAMSAESQIDQVINGGDGGGLSAQSHGNVEHIYDNGFAAILDDAGLQNVLNSDKVIAVEEDGYVQLDQVKSWGLDRIDDKDLPLDASYNPTFGNDGEGVTAYVIDTGILDTHVEFEGRAKQEYNSVSGDPNIDCNGHGTHVAGTIGSKNYGVANKAKLVGVKVLSCTGGGTWSGVIAGINWVKDNARNRKPATANMSIGGGKSASVNAAVKALVESGVSTVVAAGNSNRDACSYSPASELTAITVGSTTNTDARSSFSNYGSCVDIFAPGSSITAPWIGSNTATRTISGTSMASPHVCGGAALYLGQDKNLSPDDLVQKMLDDAIDGTITDVKSPTNKFLYVAANQTPTKTRVPTMTPTTPSSSFGPTPSSYGTGEPTGGDGTKPPTPAPTPSIICDGLNKKECKKAKDVCVFGKNKIFGDCKAKKGKYNSDCEFGEEDSCLGDSDGNCEWDGNRCSHKCNDLDGKKCKKVRNSSDDKKMCKAPKIKNPCKGCQPKTTCG